MRPDRIPESLEEFLDILEVFNGRPAGEIARQVRMRFLYFSSFGIRDGIWVGLMGSSACTS